MGGLTIHTTNNGKFAREKLSRQILPVKCVYKVFSLLKSLFFLLVSGHGQQDENSFSKRKKGLLFGFRSVSLHSTAFQEIYSKLALVSARLLGTKHTHNVVFFSAYLFFVGETSTEIIS